MNIRIIVSIIQFIFIRSLKIRLEIKALSGVECNNHIKFIFDRPAFGEKLKMVNHPNIGKYLNSLYNLNFMAKKVFIFVFSIFNLDFILTHGTS